jgi:hypothetical protein
MGIIDGSPALAPCNERYPTNSETMQELRTGQGNQMHGRGAADRGDCDMPEPIPILTHDHGDLGLYVTLCMEV